MKNGSGARRRKTGSKESAGDVTDALAKSRHPEAPETQGAHLKALAPIPPEARTVDPVAWAEKHVESLAPDAAKELEWALKFGSDTARYTAAKDMLAMKGLTTKPKEQGTIQQAMVFNFVGPTSAAGAPLLPFMNAAPALPVDTAAEPVTVEKAPTEKPKERK